MQLEDQLLVSRAERAGLPGPAPGQLVFQRIRHKLHWGDLSERESV